MKAAHALAAEGCYWEQFFAALSCAAGDESEKWMSAEVERYQDQFKLSAEDAWRTIACNLACFAAYYDTSVIRKMRKQFGVFPECFDSPEFRQEKRKSLNMSGQLATDSPV
jgi:hypothetical protein